MALQLTPLYESRNELGNILAGVEYDDVTLDVTQFRFVIKQGTHGATFTLRNLLSPFQVLTHSFSPGVALSWNPPFPLKMTLFNNPKTGQVVGLPLNWTADMALD